MLPPTSGASLPDPSEFQVPPASSSRIDISDDPGSYGFRLSSRNSSNSDVAMALADVPSSWTVSRPPPMMFSAGGSVQASGLHGSTGSTSWDSTRPGQSMNLSYFPLGGPAVLGGVNASTGPSAGPLTPGSGQFKILGLVGIMPPAPANQ